MNIFNLYSMGKPIYLRQNSNAPSKRIWTHFGPSSTPAGESINTHLNEQISNFLEVDDFRMHRSLNEPLANFAVGQMDYSLVTTL